jgi:hypothetical protein
VEARKPAQEGVPERRDEDSDLFQLFKIPSTVIPLVLTAVMVNFSPSCVTRRREESRAINRWIQGQLIAVVIHASDQWILDTGGL